MPKTTTLPSVQLELNRRFFVAVESLVQRGVIHSLSSFVCDCGLHAPRYLEMRSAFGPGADGSRPSRYVSIELEALCALVAKYNISADWLLVGRGVMYKRG